ncbi:CapA family protein [Oscillatoria salina]|uniref:CapA family protein n=1 Tax=Oscillatoria salina TaxID=331517 RepID=UPI0013BE6460|nr:CapA family protein [Oscillatoria salina]MBZ8179586.1 hypothetical protein [Oscillatoria salina IIICB1]NET88979.1 hypothetical protein [Kamptonema sp. SIO1D9]
MNNTKRSWVIFSLASAFFFTAGCAGLPSEEETTNIPQTSSRQETLPPEPPPELQAKPTPLPEPETAIVAVSISQEINQTNPTDDLQPIPLDKDLAGEFLDIRGVGDAAMALTHQQPLNLNQNLPQGVPADFGQRLDAFDPTGKSYRGDLTFINWETTVGTRCNQFWAPLGPRSFAFMSHPDNLVGAYERGFNLIGLANNHTRDCPNAEEGLDGAAVSARHLERLSQETNANWLWDGVGTQKEATVKTLEIKGRPVKVAFASLYIAEGDCTYVTCIKDELTVLRSLRDADADIRILAMHSWTSETQQQLTNIGVKFLKHFDGDIVFGHGPHVWKPVRVVESERGKKGVMFESLGNFIHPSLLPRAENIIGRALFDLDTLELRQVQIIPIYVDRVSVSFGSAPNPTALSANLNWQSVNDPTWQSGVNSQVKAAYSNIRD